MSISKDKSGQILELADKVAQELGFLVVDARFVQQGKSRTLEITIHKKGGQVGLDDCEKFSRAFDQIIDESYPELIEGSYNLEVQSPGLTRKLKTDRELEVFNGQILELKTKQKIEGLGSYFKAKLDQFNNGMIKLSNIKSLESSPKKKTQKQDMEIQAIPSSLEMKLEDFSQIRLYADFSAKGEAQLI